MKARAIALLTVLTVAVAAYATGCCCCGPPVPTDNGGGFAVAPRSNLTEVLNATKPQQVAVEVAQKY